MPVSKQQQRKHKHIKHQGQPLTVRALFKSSLLMHHNANLDLRLQPNIDPLAARLNCRIVKSPAPGNLFQSFHKATWPNHFRHAFPMIKALAIVVFITVRQICLHAAHIVGNDTVPLSSTFSPQS